MADSNDQQQQGRRRSSEVSKFANLMQHKRDPSNTEHATRRASINDQYAQKGFVGKMWDNFTKGPENNTTQNTGQGSATANLKQSISRTGAGTLG